MRKHSTTTAAIAAAALVVGIGVGYMIGRGSGAPEPAPAAQPASPAPAVSPGAVPDASGVEATLRDVFATIYQGDTTKEEWDHYCDDLITAETAAKLTYFCGKRPDDHSFHADTVLRVRDIVIDQDGTHATAVVDYENRNDGAHMTAHEELFWEGGRWKAVSRELPHS